jgi:phosphopantetheinyl transferase (holo-ACP synthase)
MAVSANTLFHFTSKESLQKILTNGFKPQYSLEDLSNFTPELSIYKKSYIPMVCFCDLIFSQIKNHMEFYGEYGIGLRKDRWGVLNGISPINYIPDGSIFAGHIQSISNEIGISIKRKSERIAIRTELKNIYKYLKPLNGKAYNRVAKRTQSKAFYDEREWRFVPRELPVLSAKKVDAAEIKIHNSNMDVKNYLHFIASDVKYIIVKHESEIPYFVRFIEDDLSGINRGSKDDLRLLATKLISAEQITEDM